MIKPTTLYIVRHGQTEFNLQKKIQGHCDSPLTAAGLNQVSELRDELKDVQFDAVFSSDLLRAVKTAEIINLERKLAITTSEFLRENHYGPYEGKTYDEMSKKYKKLWDEFDTLSETDRRKAKVDQTMESEEEAASRYITFLREIAISHTGKKVLIVSHGGIMKTLLVHLGYAKYAQLQSGAVQNCGLIILESDGIDFFVKETRRIIIS